MNKLKTILVSGFVAALSLSSIANAIEFRAGITANTTVYYGNVTEQVKDNGKKNSDEALAAFGYGSGFAEVAFDSIAGIAVGLEHVPSAISLETTTRVIRSSLYASGGTPTGETTDGDIQNIAADVTDLNTIYIAIPIMDTGLSIKAGYMMGTLETKETLSTGSSYKDVDLDGRYLGGFYDGTLGDVMFYRIEGGYVLFDDITATGTQEGVAASGSFNKITAELGGVRGAFSIGARF